MKQIAVRVDDATHGLLEKQADAERRSLASLCRNILVDYVKKGSNAKDSRETKKR